MKETFYFSHDYNARNDEKTTKLLSKEKLEGYGIYWILIEKLYEAGGYISRDYDCLAFDMRTDAERIKRIIEDYSLFSVDKKRIWSKSVLSRLAIRKEKSEKARNSAKVRWSNTNAMRSQSDSNAIKERKGKEIKIKENKVESVTTPSQIAKDFFNNTDAQLKVIYQLKEKHGADPAILESEIGKFISYWTELNKSGTKQRWELQKTFEVQRRLATWFRNYKNFDNNFNKSKTLIAE